MAASAAMLCVPSFSAAAVNFDDGFIDLSRTQAQCSIAMQPLGVPGFTFEHQMSYRLTGGESLDLAGTKLAGQHLPADDTSTDGGTTETDGSAGADTTSTESDGGEFSGSAAPAGPDLTPAEEEGLISGGWK